MKIWAADFAAPLPTALVGQGRRATLCVIPGTRARDPSQRLFWAIRFARRTPPTVHVRTCCMIGPGHEARDDGGEVNY